MNPLFAFGLPGGSEWFWIFLAVVLLFGPKKIPDLMRGLGRGVGEFKKAKEEFEKEIQQVATEKKPDEIKGKDVAATTTGATPGSTTDTTNGAPKKI